jgi:hypothetical protein
MQKVANIINHILIKHLAIRYFFKVQMGYNSVQFLFKNKL